MQQTERTICVGGLITGQRPTECDVPNCSVRRIARSTTQKLAQGRTTGPDILDSLQNAYDSVQSGGRGSIVARSILDQSAAEADFDLITAGKQPEDCPKVQP